MTIVPRPPPSPAAQGSNPARTRKYQMGITKFFKDIPSNLGVLGLIIENLDVKDSHSWRWDNSRIGTNYHAFFLYSK
ncbi:DUF6934 family protein [Dyadobacter frigoris]|uniref:Uncharacterized protein n=1 Tax=Dyadobacter frigoris TaxID=2576211 RepID=A0A4U6DBD3_9BACT|nr:hypothetical protein [Dyadobacter frigoris]TKT94065.1 hypothetical protein FDK13_02315 [Dyadobacter frigoris]